MRQGGHSKDQRPDLPQVKLLAAAAEPSGHLVAGDIQPGPCADDPLYTPLIQRVGRLLGRTGLGYAGDCKRAALATRAELAAHQDYDGLAWPLTGELAAQCAAWVDAVVDGPQEVELLWDGEHLVGAGSELARPVRAVVDGEPVRWSERVQLVRAVTLAPRRQSTLDKQLATAAAELGALTPAPGRGQRPLREEATLTTASASVLARQALTGLLTVPWERHQTTVTHYVGRGRGGPDRTLTARYGFHHALYQQLWHERVTPGRQQQFHLRIGHRKEVGYNGRVQEIAAELAVHFEQGRDYQKAVQYHQQAAERAMRRSAPQEAIQHLTPALALLQRLPDTHERTQYELTLQLALGSALMATKGYAALEAEHVYMRARELCQRVGETPQLAPMLWGLQTFYSMNGDLQTAIDMTEQLMRVAQSTQDPAALILAHRLYGVHSYWWGELASALNHLEQVLTLYDRQQHHALAFLSVTDSGVHCEAYAAWTLWCLGYPDQALTRIHKALALARELSHPTTLAFALNCTVELYQLRREVEVVHKQAEALIALSTEQGLPYFLASGTIWLGWALVKQGLADGGVAQIRHGLAVKRAGLEETYFLVVLAEACGRTGQAEEGLAVVAEALALVDKSGLRVFEAELYRLKGELSLQSRHVKAGQGKSKVTNPQPPTSGTQSAAEECFWKAIEIARKQQAKSLELRAVMSLSQLWQQQGKKEEAHEMLAEIYGWFTEGFDTADLKEAKALLAELA